MTRLLAIFIIGLGLGGGGGFLVAGSEGVTFDGHVHDDHNQWTAITEKPAHIHHSFLNVPAVGAPTLSIQMSKDSTAGWNLQISTENFRFSPKQAGHAHVENEGHAHLFINGTKHSRLYGEWVHIGVLPENAKVEVTLNSNDHRALSVEGQPISAELTLSASH